MSEKKIITRREFINKSVKGAALVGLGGAIGLTASRLSGRRNDISEESNYELQKISAVDPALIKYKEAGKIKVEAQSLQAIAVGPDDRVYIAAGKTIQVFNIDAERLQEFKLNDSPRCLNITDNGAIYAGMKDHLEIYNPKGLLEARWGSLGPSAVLTSIAVSEGNVFVADAGNRVVLRYDVSGKMACRIGKRDESRNVPGFSVPSPYFDVAASSDGLLRVANPGQHRIEAYTYDGDFEFSWGNPSIGIDGFCGCCNPVNFAILPDGRFVTCEKGLPRVKIYTADGTLECVVAEPGVFIENSKFCTLAGFSSCLSGGLDVAADSQGRILVMDPVEKVVRIFTREA